MDRIGIDLGGTKTEVAVIDSAGHTRFSKRAPTPRPYAEKIVVIASLVSEAREFCQSDSVSIGIGHPGSINPATGKMRNANSTELNGHPLDKDIEAAIGQPVRCANDANCFALSEAVDGAGAGASSVFGVILGTGVGGGLVIDGKLHQGHGLLGGEWGHNGLPWPNQDEVPGRDCKCGLRGCMETWLSGPGLTDDHLNRSKAFLSPSQIVAAAIEGHSGATLTMERFYDRLARGLSTVINIVDPEVIVLGGGLSNINGLADAVLERLPAYVFSDQVTTKVRKHKHGDSSGVRGAAWLWPLE
ncbi:ROK family protein [Hyphobacterium sp. HN65]|uniref:ROK family protein n=1 Tax=Hyphobacterium lacteum TaxID=3116575 RepID=A0ABU7LP71_9PROT|nr:ROK family protein [Hyphobacterium sp. HN65]MEE2525134.1 ROK family protein [Hyphobacterium sp. HN65]